MHISFKNYEMNGYGHDLGLLIILHLMKCFMSCKKWVQREKYPSKVCLPY